MTAKKRSRNVLGRGLSNLIPVEETEVQNNSNRVESIDINAIKVNPYQPRIDFDEEEIKNLAESIKNQGLLQPVVVRKTPDGYEIISGERRYRAIKYLGETTVPCIVKENVSDTEMLEMALVENIQRQNLNDIEVAISYQKLLFDCGLSHQQLSERVGKSRSAITNTLRLLKLPEEIQNMVRDGKISSGHARALLSLGTEEEQINAAKKIIEENLSVRDIEKIAQEGSKKNNNKKEKVEKIDPDLLEVENKLRYHLGTDTVIKGKPNKGKIEIKYYSQEDLNRILDLIMK